MKDVQLNFVIALFNYTDKFYENSIQRGKCKNFLVKNAYFLQ